MCPHCPWTLQGIYCTVTNKTCPVRITMERFRLARKLHVGTIRMPRICVLFSYFSISKLNSESWRSVVLSVLAQTIIIPLVLGCGIHLLKNKACVKLGTFATSLPQGRMDRKGENDVNIPYSRK